eukprot:CAMPEP_0119016146 /NCGR_PEP_ID=MMETSP1176-20130426/11841_1 /TAXON_ID=265551 /ORGANISM="Synedropsis recta cf, Strain CCMP1620" /LENGTH=354 /DNA_ID=CAMNT_0006969479 /DNA_START=63 /DNA_END=1124 /DNA_ORIENTATION=-
MDLLKKEMERKKKARALAKGQSTSGGSRYVKAADLRRVQEEEEERLRLKRPRVIVHKGTPEKDTETDKEQSKNKEDNDAKNGKNEGGEPVGKKQRSNSNNLTTKLSPQQVLMRLRALGLPIRMFGESLENRIGRLQTALESQKSQSAINTEMDEFRLGKGHGIRNRFLDKKEDEPDEQKTDTNSNKEESAAAAAAAAAVKKKEEKEEKEDMTDDPVKKIYRYFRGLLRQWEEDLALRPDAVKRTLTGKNETKTLKQCKDYIRPLFKLCKTRKLEEGLMIHLAKIVDYCKEGEFVKAHDSYLDVAIGRAAWPIGVTMVGIHARSGRAKIEAANVAHVMNSELQRKYLTSVKRLMT